MRSCEPARSFVAPGSLPRQWAAPLLRFFGEGVPSLVLRYGIAVLASASATLLTLRFEHFMERNLFMLLFAAVAVSALLGGLGPGVLSTLLGAAASGYLFLEPLSGGAVNAGEDQVRLAAFVLVGMAVSGLSESLRASRRRAAARDRALRETNDALQTLIRAAPPAIVAVDSAGRVESWNPAAERMLGWSREEVLGRDGWLVPLEGVPGAAHLRGALLRGGGMAEVEGRCQRSDGEWVDVTLSVAPLRDAAGTVRGTMAVVADATARRRAEESARMYQRAREGAQARDEVMGVVSHDLRNPLHAVSLSASLMLTTPMGDPERRRMLEGILRAADSMERLIRDLLDVTAIEAGRLSVVPAPVEAAALVEEARGRVEGTAGEQRVRVAGRVPDSLPPVLADRERALQVLSNLLGNALSFTPPGGEVGVGAEVMEGAVRFHVSDTGPGIPAEHVPHLFDRFWRAPGTQRNGVGLGLSIARGIVEAHGGRIWVESRPGEGSTFFFTLPRA